LKAKFIVLLLINYIFLNACDSVALIPLTEVPTPKTATLILSPTNTLAVTAIPWSTPTPVTLSGYPTLQIPIGLTDIFPKVPIKQVDFSTHELYIGKYVVRNWCKELGEFSHACIVTVSSIGEKQIEITGFPAWLGRQTGVSLTGNGIPDIVIDTASGGSDNGERVIVYEAGDSPRMILTAIGNMVNDQEPGEFMDLNGDGSFEYIGLRRFWSQFCAYCELWNPIVYEYQGKSGYVPATYKFKDFLNPLIEDALDDLSGFRKKYPNILIQFTARGEEGNINDDYFRAVNDVYKLTAYYLMLGQKEDAMKILNENFPPDKALEYIEEIRSDIGLFIAP